MTGDVGRGSDGASGFRLSPELEELRSRLREFGARVIQPLEERYMTAGRLPDDELARLQAQVRDEGLWMLDIPREHGGQGWGLLGACVLAEETEHYRVLPFRRNEVFGPRIGPILLSLDAEQSERFLVPALRGEAVFCFAQTEPDAGSDPAAITTRAVRDGSSYLLSGTKRFIGSADRADFAQVVCRTTAQDGRDSITCLIVDMSTAGVQLVRPWHTMMGDTVWEVRFDRVRVPEENRVGQEGEGFRLAQTWITHGRIRNHGARCVGIARRALDMMIDRAGRRQTFGAPLSDRQAVQFMVADSATELRMVELLVHETAWRYELGEDVREASYMVKIAATEMASRVVDRSMQIHGGLGLTTDLPLEYWYRQLRSIRITEGATEVLRWRLGRNLLRSPRA